MIESLNPAAFAFFVGALATIVTQNTSIINKFFYWLEIIILGAMWFSGVAVLATHHKVLAYTANHTNKIEITSSVIFISLGGSLLSTVI